MIAKFLLPVLSLLVAGCVFFLYIEPTYTGAIADSKAQIASYDAALVAAQQFNLKESQLVAEENQIPAASIQRLESYLPDGVDNVQLILDLNSLASRSGISLSNFAVTDNDPTAGSASTDASAQGTTSTTGNGDAIPASDGTSPVDSLDLSVQATGTYSAFRTFLAASEQSLRPLDVTALSVTDSATGVYSYSITFRIYWLQ
jgi:hypothetical protein